MNAYVPAGSGDKGHGQKSKPDVEENSEVVNIWNRGIKLRDTNHVVRVMLRLIERRCKNTHHPLSHTRDLRPLISPSPLILHLTVLFRYLRRLAEVGSYDTETVNVHDVGAYDIGNIVGVQQQRQRCRVTAPAQRETQRDMERGEICGDASCGGMGCR